MNLVLQLPRKKFEHLCRIPSIIKRPVDVNHCTLELRPTERSRELFVSLLIVAIIAEIALAVMMSIARLTHAVDSAAAAVSPATSLVCVLMTSSILMSTTYLLLCSQLLCKLLTVPKWPRSRVRSGTQPLGCLPSPPRRFTQ